VSETLLAALLVLLVLLAVVAVRAADLLIAVIALGAYGFTMALTWAALGAADVAFTEAVVGAGATTVFFLAALLRTSRRRSAVPRVRWLPLGVTVVVGAAILAVGAALPRWGDPEAPAAVHVSPRYLTRAVAETKTPNVVTAVLADYRSYDTLVETVVILTAGLGCWALLARRDGAAAGAASRGEGRGPR
jgi:multicomponent Na+:H+ antiporter subunit B